ncbi:MAG: Bor family protein [Rhodothermales bacterium]|nr:Bor family protein [Rhodothermales bacterium]MBO6780106.1 Bor family protein [Rhodothermales bacterium]
MRIPATTCLLLLAMTLGGCYHTSVLFDNEPSNRVEEIWAHSFVYGLVPPDEVNAEEICGRSGAHKIETQISFVNGLVGALTFSVYTPMTITVTCAQ